MYRKKIEKGIVEKSALLLRFLQQHAGRMLSFVDSQLFTPLFEVLGVFMEEVALQYKTDSKQQTGVDALLVEEAIDV